MNRRSLPWLSVAFLALVGCGDDPLCADVICGDGSVCGAEDGLCHCGEAGPVCGDEEVCGVSGCEVPLPEAMCTAGTRFVSGTGTFREATDAWGLRGVEGVRLNVTDIDGDGRADLVVRRGGPAFDDFGPDGVRRTYLLHNRGLMDAGTGFEDVTQSSGLLTLRNGGDPNAGRPVEIIAFGDVDDDGDLDAYLGIPTYDAEFTMGEHSEILLNRGDGTFELSPESDVRSPEFFDVPAGASFVDVDRDGNLDLWVPQHNFSSAGGGVVFLHDRLYRGDGTGAFTEITVSAGVMTQPWESFADLDGGLAHSRAWGSLARDLDGDGTSELLVPSYGRAPNLFWRGQRAADGSVTFANESVASGYAFDGDMTWEDNEFARCFCASNREAEGCADLPPSRLMCSDNWSHDQDRHAFRLGGNSGATSAGDVDADGDLDLLTGEIKHWWAGAGADGGELLINDGNARFARPGDDVTGLGVEHLGVSWDEGHMTNALFDFDNDGLLDVYIGGSDYAGNRGHLYHQESPLRFTEVSTGDSFEHNRSHGVVVADFDGDGDLDIIVGHSRARCDASGPNDCYETAQVRAFENLSAPGNWMQVVLVGGANTNRAAIGAQVTVASEGRTLLQEVDGGHGHYGSQSDLVLHFGLGAACAGEVTVRWPDADLSTETFTLPAGHRFEITQGEGVRAVTP